MSEYFTYGFNTQQTGQVQKCSGYGLAELISKIENPVGVEIGVDVGHTTEFLLKSHDKLKLICIDPFANYIDWNGNNLNERDSIYKEFVSRTNPFGDRIQHIRKTSDDAVNDIADNSLDFIFIDGLHTYDQVMKDMQNYYSKMKNGAIFAGHDYNVIEDVNRAVREFAKTKNKDILETECDVWYWYK